MSLGLVARVVAVAVAMVTTAPLRMSASSSSSDLCLSTGLELKLGVVLTQEDFRRGAHLAYQVHSTSLPHFPFTPFEVPRSDVQSRAAILVKLGLLLWHDKWKDRGGGKS